MPTSITSSGITFNDATTQSTSATKAGGIGTSQLANGAVTSAKLDSVGQGAGSPPVYGCRAWVNFDGTVVNGANECTIRGSGNVTKVVRNGTGNYTVYFATAMPDTNYAAVMFNNASSTGTTAVNFNNSYVGGIGNKTVSTVGVTSYGAAGAYINSAVFDVVVFR